MKLGDWAVFEVVDFDHGEVVDPPRLDEGRVFETPKGYRVVWPDRQYWWPRSRGESTAATSVQEAFAEWLGGINERIEEAQRRLDRRKAAYERAVAFAVEHGFEP